MYTFDEMLLWKENNLFLSINSVDYAELKITDHIEKYYDLNITIEKEN